MVLGQHALGLVGGHHGHAQVLGDLAEPGGGAALHDAPAGQEDRTFCIGQRGPDGGDRAHGRGWRRWQFHGPGLGDIGGISLHVHGHRDEYGARTATGRQRIGLRQDAGQLVHARHLPLALGDGLEQRGQVGPGLAVDLLEHATPEHVGVHVAREDEHRGGVHVRGGDAHGRVHGTGPD